MDDRQQAVAIGAQIRLVRKNQGLTVLEAAGKILAARGEEEAAPRKIKAQINRLSRVERGERQLKASEWKELKDVLSMTEEEEEACLFVAHDEVGRGSPEGLKTAGNLDLSGRLSLLLDRELLESVVSHMEKELQLSGIDVRGAVERLCRLYIHNLQGE